MALQVERPIADVITWCIVGDEAAIDGRARKANVLFGRRLNRLDRGTLRVLRTDAATRASSGQVMLWTTVSIVRWRLATLKPLTWTVAGHDRLLLEASGV